VECAASNLTRAFCNDIGHGEHLIRLLVKQKVVVSEMAASHMPMKILRLQVKTKSVGQQTAESLCNVRDRSIAERSALRSDLTDCAFVHGSSCTVIL
jgi:hypothetical protein